MHGEMLLYDKTQLGLDHQVMSLVLGLGFGY